MQVLQQGLKAIKRIGKRSHLCVAGLGAVKLLDSRDFRRDP